MNADTVFNNVLEKLKSYALQMKCAYEDDSKEADGMVEYYETKLDTLREIAKDLEIGDFYYDAFRKKGDVGFVIQIYYKPVNVDEEYVLLFETSNKPFWEEGGII